MFLFPAKTHAGGCTLSKGTSQSHFFWACPGRIDRESQARAGTPSSHPLEHARHPMTPPSLALYRRGQQTPQDSPIRENTDGKTTQSRIIAEQTNPVVCSSPPPLPAVQLQRTYVIGSAVPLTTLPAGHQRPISPAHMHRRAEGVRFLTTANLPALVTWPPRRAPITRASLDVAGAPGDLGVGWGRPIAVGRDGVFREKKGGMVSGVGGRGSRGWSPRGLILSLNDSHHAAGQK